MLSRRRFLGSSLMGGAAIALLGGPVNSMVPAAGTGDIVLVLASHWSYIGIGWQLGIESCVVSVIDAIGMADLQPGVRTCLEMDAHAYEIMAENFPEVTDKLKKYLAAGKVELVGGAFGQPMATMFSGETNIRQIVVGREAICKSLGYEMKTFLEEEEFSHPQLPQMLAGSEYEYASIAQLDTWGRAGVPFLDLNVFRWQGKDGTMIGTTPKNPLFTKGLNQEFQSLPALKELESQGKALVVDWEEFGWDAAETPAYLTDSKKYQEISDKLGVEYLTLKEYMDKYGRNPKKTIYLDMDRWTKLLPWGIGGDQLRILDRKVEGLLLAAEEFDAVAHHFGAETRKADLEQAWRDLMTSQSHDVALCEYSRWQGRRMAPLDRIDDLHNFAWGAIGYNHLDAAQKRGESVLNTTLHGLVGKIDSQAQKQGELAAVVFNPYAWERTGAACTGRVDLRNHQSKAVVVRDAAGHVVPSQLIANDTVPAGWEKDAQGNLQVATVAFLAGHVPSTGYDTYYLDLSSESSQPATTDLKVDEDRFEMENEHVKIKLSATQGNITSLVDKNSGREMLNGSTSPFPVFRGRANPNYPAPRGPFYGDKNSQRPTVGEMVFGSSSMKPALVQWVEKGPIRATLKTRYEWPLLTFETDVRLSAGSPWVEVVSRILTAVPPAVDRVENGRFPLEVEEGYWIDFAPNFAPKRILRDYAFAIEPTSNNAFHALTFTDLEDDEGGLLVLHAGTQYFKRNDVGEGVFSNLLMREWESYFSDEYGFPRYAEYRHALMPHGSSFTNGQRLRASKEFTQDLITVVSPPKGGALSARKSFLSLGPGNVQVCAYRKKANDRTELRVVNYDDQQAEVKLEMGLPVNAATETNLLGRKVKDMQMEGTQLRFDLKPWGFRTFELT
ncbi:MAG TPA: glycoside hydrolase family 38 C-terminal domain-containing protein [Terriglobia bacterium]|nr:glycoside hydrolase family 38 C-terminal domain-containing protein [Terriglobia bacterium]